MAEVDEFLEQARAALTYDPPLMTPGEVERKRFRPVRVRTGYDMGQVDDHLDVIAGELRRREVPDEVSGDASRPDVEPVAAHRAVPWLSLLAVAVLVAVVLMLVR